MSQENKHIDELFRTGLAGNEALPPPELWKKINGQLVSMKRISILKATLRIAAGMAVILGVGGSLIYYFIQDTPGDNYLLPEQTVTIPMSGKESAPDHFPIPPSRQDQVSVLPAHDASLAVINATSTPRTAKLPSVFQVPAKEQGFDDSNFATHVSSLGAGRVESSSPLRQTASLSRKPVFLPEPGGERPVTRSVGDRGRRWQVGILSAPNYSYRSIFSGTDKNLDKSAFNSSEAGLVSITAKIAVSYSLSERIALQSGLEIVNVGQVTGAILCDFCVRKRYDYMNLIPPQDSPTFQNSLGTVQTGENIVLVAGNNERGISGFMPLASRVADHASGPGSRGNVIQELYYIQAPLTFRFSLVRGNNMNLILNAGMGVNFLAGNNVVYELDGKFLDLGRTPGIRNIGFSGIAGAGLERNIANNTSLVLEPRFTHFISSVIRTTDHLHLPYSISFFGGIYHKF
jgi:hypothetical protein